MENIQYITLETLITGLKDKTVSINPNGYWENSPQLLEWVVDKLERELKQQKEQREEDWKQMSEEHRKQYGKATYEDIVAMRTKLPLETIMYVRSNTGMRFESYTPLHLGFSKIYITGLPTALPKDRFGIPLLWGETSSEIKLGKEEVNTYELYSKPTVSEVEYEKGFVIQNYFALCDEVEENIDYHKKDLATVTGLQYIQDQYAKHNFMFGQVGNCSLYFYELQDKFVVTNQHPEFIYEYAEYDETEKWKLDWFLKNIGEDTEPLKIEGSDYTTESLDLSVWRYEAIPQERFPEEQVAKPQDWGDIPKVVIPYSGKLRVENYYRQKTELPDFVVAIWHKI